MEKSQELQKKCAMTVGRYKIYHYGHLAYHLKLLEEFDKVVIFVGSCYVHGTERNSTLSVFIIKCIEAALSAAGIPKERYYIKCMRDYSTFDEWFQKVLKARDQFGATHFVTGNQEDILSVIKKEHYELKMELINPEEGSSIPYHGSEIREHIRNQNFEAIKEMLPSTTRNILFTTSTFEEIMAASQNRGIDFVPGTQTVDLVLLVRNREDGRVYVLLGKRDDTKKDFKGYFGIPGGIINDDEFETPFDALCRSLKETTGLEMNILDNTMEPAVIQFNNVENSEIEMLKFIGLYSTTDEKLAGSRGGSSQCFCCIVDDDLEKYKKSIQSGVGFETVDFYDVEEVKNITLAYQQNDMLQKALDVVKAFPLVSQEKKSFTRFISIIGGSRETNSTIATGIEFLYKQLGIECMVLDHLSQENLQEVLDSGKVIITYEHSRLNTPLSLLESYSHFVICLDPLSQRVNDSFCQDMHFVQNEKEAFEIALDYAKTSITPDLKEKKVRLLEIS